MTGHGGPFSVTLTDGRIVYFAGHRAVLAHIPGGGWLSTHSRYGWALSLDVVPGAEQVRIVDLLCFQELIAPVEMWRARKTWEWTAHECLAYLKREGQPVEGLNLDWLACLDEADIPDEIAEQLNTACWAHQRRTT